MFVFDCGIYYLCVSQLPFLVFLIGWFEFRFFFRCLMCFCYSYMKCVHGFVSILLWWILFKERDLLFISVWYSTTACCLFDPSTWFYSTLAIWCYGCESGCLDYEPWTEITQISMHIRKEVPNWCFLVSCRIWFVNCFI